MDDESRLFDVKADKDMVQQAFFATNNKMSIISHFYSLMMFSLSNDGNMLSAHRSITIFAHEMKVLSAHLESIAEEGMKRAK